MLGCGGGERVGERGGAIGADAEIADGAAEAAQERRQHDAVGVVNRAGSQPVARLAHLIAGRHQRDPQRPAYRERRVAERGGEAEIGGRQAAAGGERNAAARDILAGMAAVGARLDTGREPDAVAVDDAILLHHHRVGALGHRRAGKDADRLAAPSRATERVAGGRPTGDRQHRLAVGQEVGVEDRVAVDGAVGIGRHVDFSDKIAREDAAGCRRERDGLFRDNGNDTLPDQRERGIDTEQRAAESKTVVAQLRHQPSPK